VLIHRGKNPSSLRMEIFINDILLTTFFGDGMIFSTPMGSLGYSLSSSGPILNYETSSIIIVPICPLSLSFRPICIPDTSQIKIRLL
jgi:NAD kinase